MSDKEKPRHEEEENNNRSHHEEEENNDRSHHEEEENNDRSHHEEEENNDRSHHEEEENNDRSHHEEEENNDRSHHEEEENDDRSHHEEEENNDRSHHEEEENNDRSHHEEEENNDRSHHEEEENNDRSHHEEEENNDRSHHEEEENNDRSHHEEEENNDRSHHEEEENNDRSHHEEEENDDNGSEERPSPSSRPSRLLEMRDEYQSRLMREKEKKLVKIYHDNRAKMEQRIERVTGSRGSPTVYSNTRLRLPGFTQQASGFATTSTSATSTSNTLTYTTPHTSPNTTPTHNDPHFQLSAGDFSRERMQSMAPDSSEQRCTQHGHKERPLQRRLWSARRKRSMMGVDRAHPLPPILESEEVTSNRSSRDSYSTGGIPSRGKLPLRGMPSRAQPTSSSSDPGKKTPTSCQASASTSASAPVSSTTPASWDCSDPTAPQDTKKLNVSDFHQWLNERNLSHVIKRRELLLDSLNQDLDENPTDFEDEEESAGEDEAVREAGVEKVEDVEIEKLRIQRELEDRPAQKEAEFEQLKKEMPEGQQRPSTSVGAKKGPLNFRQRNKGRGGILKKCSMESTTLDHQDTVCERNFGSGDGVDSAQRLEGRDLRDWDLWQEKIKAVEQEEEEEKKQQHEKHQTEDNGSRQEEGEDHTGSKQKKHVRWLCEESGQPDQYCDDIDRINHNERMLVARALAKMSCGEHDLVTAFLGHENIIDEQVAEQEQSHRHNQNECSSGNVEQERMVLIEEEMRINLQAAKEELSEGQNQNVGNLSCEEEKTLASTEEEGQIRQPMATGGQGDQPDPDWSQQDLQALGYIEEELHFRQQVFGEWRGRHYQYGNIWSREEEEAHIRKEKVRQLIEQEAGGMRRGGQHMEGEPQAHREQGMQSRLPVYKGRGRGPRHDSVDTQSRKEEEPRVVIEQEVQQPDASFNMSQNEKHRSGKADCLVESQDDHVSCNSSQKTHFQPESEPDRHYQPDSRHPGVSSASGHSNNSTASNYSQWLALEDVTLEEEGAQQPSLSTEQQNEVPGPVKEEEQDDRVPCKICRRRFNKDRVEKHESICKVIHKKRQIYDPVKKRTEGTPMAQYNRVGANKKLSPATKRKDWRKNHKVLIDSLHTRQVDKQGEADKDRRGPQPLVDNSDLVPCPHCNRTFNVDAAKRHIPRCKDLKTKPLPKPRR